VLFSVHVLGWPRGLGVEGSELALEARGAGVPPARAPPVQVQPLERGGVADAVLEPALGRRVRPLVYLLNRVLESWSSPTTP